ncbi:ABC transporter permease [Sutcliffiella rhizosphaerae]|uniref:ABC transporter permease YtrF n=1 Tax=Sutcliffiella rhizosphaerae TaxID=2880967 RepID=A0ABN8A9Q9_9BACI|nr:FtsX-like permease family protein [Sutcliffiella rhizosphaerae]CAG9620601.1 ABC transporter permease YtrF [Sutcliffiella rhizosphaerae]
MKFIDKYQFVRENMKKNRSRVYMTILATAMGCAFLMVLASIGFGLQETIVKDITQNDVVTEIEVGGKSSEEESSGLTDEDITYFESFENVKIVLPQKKLENWEAIYELDGYTSQYSETRVVNYDLETEAGFTLSEGRMPENDNEIVVGFHFAESLWKESESTENVTYEDSILNSEMTLTVPQYFGDKRETKEWTFKIVGIGEEPANKYAMDSFVNISLQSMQEIEAFTETAYGVLLELYMTDEQIQAAKEVPSNYSYLGVFATSMEEVLPILDKIREEGYYAYSPLERLREVNVLFAVMKIGLIFVGTVAVLIASIGIFNTMSMAVTERTQDIGIMKAIGGSPRMIKSLFLMESAYIGLIGAVIGTIASFIISSAANKALPIIMELVFDEQIGDDILLSYIPLSLALICVGISLLVATLSGLKPASKATRIDVLQALRRDI